MGGWILVGCSDGPVRVDPPDPPSSAAEACSRLADELPTEVADVEERGTDPASELTAAWGDPAITLRCGVDQPPEYQPTSDLVTVNGIDWLAVEGEGGYLFYASGRVAWVEVAVPSAYAPEVNPLLDLAAGIAAAVSPLEESS